jgi:hypothetical protein
MKPMRKVIVTMHTRDLECYDPKTSEYIPISNMPDSVRQHFTWDEYLDVEIDVNSGEITVLPSRE